MARSGISNKMEAAGKAAGNAYGNPVVAGDAEHRSPRMPGSRSRGRAADHSAGAWALGDQNVTVTVAITLWNHGSMGTTGAASWMF